MSYSKNTMTDVAEDLKVTLKTGALPSTSAIWLVVYSGLINLVIVEIFCLAAVTSATVFS